MQARGCQKENQELDEDIFALESAVVERQRLCELQGMQHTTSHCITLQRTATHCNAPQQWWNAGASVNYRVCNTLHHTAIHCNTLQHTATTVERRRLCEPLGIQHTATHCNILQHTATYCKDGGAPAPL